MLKISLDEEQLSYDFELKHRIPFKRHFNLLLSI